MDTQEISKDPLITSHTQLQPDMQSASEGGWNNGDDQHHGLHSGDEEEYQYNQDRFEDWYVYLFSKTSQH